MLGFFFFFFFTYSSISLIKEKLFHSISLIIVVLFCNPKWDMVTSLFTMNATFRNLSQREITKIPKEHLIRYKHPLFYEF